MFLPLILPKIELSILDFKSTKQIGRTHSNNQKQITAFYEHSTNSKKTFRKFKGDTTYSNTINKSQKSYAFSPCSLSSKNTVEIKNLNSKCNDEKIINSSELKTAISK